MLTNVFKTLFLNASNLNFYQDIVWFTSVKIIDILRLFHCLDNLCRKGFVFIGSFPFRVCKQYLFFN